MYAFFIITLCLAIINIKGLVLTCIICRIWLTYQLQPCCVLREKGNRDCCRILKMLNELKMQTTGKGRKVCITTIMEGINTT